MFKENAVICCLLSLMNFPVRGINNLVLQVRAGVVGYPNVGKSSLINRLLKRRMCPAAPRPGVTRELKYAVLIFTNV